MVICLQQGANDLHMVQLMSMPPHHHPASLKSFLVPAYPGCPGKEAVKWASVCLAVGTRKSVLASNPVEN